MRVVIATSWNDKEVSLTHQCKLMLSLNVGFIPLLHQVQFDDRAVSDRHKRNNGVRDPVQLSEW